MVKQNGKQTVKTEVQSWRLYHGAQLGWGVEIMVMIKLSPSIVKGFTKWYNNGRRT